MAANAGTSVCLRKIDAALIFRLMKEHRVTHYCGAPIVHTTLINADPALREGITHKVSAMVAAAAPPAALIEGMERIGVDLTHVYGLTETYGPATVCAKHEEIIEHCRAHLAHFKAPRAVVFGVLPKTSTGKLVERLAPTAAHAALAHRDDPETTGHRPGVS